MITTGRNKKSQMQKDVDRLLAIRDRGPWDSEHRRMADAKQAKRKRVMGRVK